MTQKAIERAKVEGIDKDKELSDPTNEYYNDLTKYSLKRMSFYNCFTCNNPYFGGMRACGDQE